MERIKQSTIAKWLQRYKHVLGVLIIIGTFAFLGVYLYVHPQILRNVFLTPWPILIILTTLYCLVTITNAIITYATVRLCKKTLSSRESILLSIYSTLINFFGPLQSGPGMRAVYVKTKLGVRIRDYTYATLLYYLAFATINGALLFAGEAPVLTLTGGIVGIGCMVFAAKKLRLRQPRLIAMIYLTTLVQILLMTVIYYIELRATHTEVGFLPSLAYSASANLSMFVSLTPGAIGIREGFLVFAQSLHHISLSSIVAAGILDRAFYVLFLLGLLGVSSGLHIKQALFRKKAA